jgi:hypothetical protein
MYGEYNQGRQIVNRKAQAPTDKHTEHVERLLGEKKQRSPQK